jgi:hypothetical protein
MHAMERLAETVREAYRVFKRPKPATLGVCRGCCMYPEIEADFLNHEPKDLKEHYVEDWFFAAEAEDFGKPIMAWVLPRMLEIMATGGMVASVGDEAAFGRVGRAGAADWRDEERAVLQGFFSALLARVIEDPERAMMQLDDLLCCVGEARMEVTPLIAELEALDDKALTELFWADVFWSESRQRREVWDWYTSARLADRFLAYGAGGVPGKGADRAIRNCALRIAETIMAASDPPQG